jgi:1,4-dihydroxy-2-naphthoate octaprenyltransferase
MAVAPVMVGTALPVGQGYAFRPAPMLAALAGAILIQAGTNLYNDVADALRGADLPIRQGPPRVTALGWASPARVRAAALLCFLMAAVDGLYLAGIGGWPILVLGLAALAAGWAYSCGPRPIAYSPLGEVFVVAFFGIGAVAGSAWLQAESVVPQGPLLGLVIGLPAAAVLMANNYRDMEADRLAGRRTLAIHLGVGGSRIAYAAFMLVPFGLLALPDLPAPCLLGLIALPMALNCVRAFHRRRRGPDFNAILAATARCQLLLAVATALGLLLT